MTSPSQQLPQPATPEPTDETQQVVKPSRMSVGRMAWLLVLFGLIALFLWVGLKTWRVYGAARSLLVVQDEAQALLAEGVNEIDPDAAESLVLGARQDIVTLHDELGILRPIAPYLGWIPKLGPALVASPYLLAMADAGSEAGALAVSSLKPALAVVQREDFSGARLGELLPLLSDAAPDLTAAGDLLQRYKAARAGLGDAVAQDELPWRVQQLLETSDKWLPTAEDGLRLAPLLPAFLGQDGPQRYLILAQNEDELRATGGFITGAGVLTVQNGQIIGLDFRDANNVDNWRDKPYDFPPQSLYDFMGLELFLFRDANYWPDFPTSAQKAIDLFVYGQDAPPLDGAIAIDQEFLRLLVEATGPVPIPGTDRKISADNLLTTLREARNIQEGQEVQDWVRDRKAFLGGFATAIQAKVEDDFGSIDPVKLVGNLAGAAEEGHLSLYMRDPALAAALNENGWDGRLPQAPPGDFWAVVDYNMGYNKVNLLVERAFQYEVSLGLQPQATLTVHYQHTGATSDKPCFQGVQEEFEQASDYLTLADQCYWNFLRVYAPAGSRLIDSSRHVVPGETLFSGNTWDSAGQTLDELPNLTTFANFMLLSRGEEATAYFRYELPAGITEQDGESTLYRLIIHKQPGTRPESLRLSITLPDGATVLETTPSATAINGGQIEFDTTLDRDVEITLWYRGE